MSSQATAPSAHSRTKASAPTKDVDSTKVGHNNKENDRPSAHRRVQAKKNVDNTDEYYESEKDMDVDAGLGDDDDENHGFVNAGLGAVLMPDNDSDDEEDEDADTTRTARPRRVSEKEAQRRAEKVEAEVRKAAKAAKAAKKQRQPEVEPEPLDDTLFTSHNVELPVKKTLKQRDTRVPPMQVRSAMISNSSDTQRGRTREPVQDLRHIINRQDTADRGARFSHTNAQAGPSTQGGGRVASRSISDWRKSAVMPPMEMDSEPPRPRSINGHFLPARVHVDLRDAPATQQQARIRDDHLSVRHRNTSRSRTRSRSRSRSPTTGDKRARSPDDDIRVTQAQKTTDHQGRPRAKDYDDTTQALIDIASIWFRCLLATKEGFPEHLDEVDMVKLSLAKGEEELKISMPLTPEIAKLIGRRGPQMRGELKTKVRALTELVFGFESGQNRKNVRKNRQLAEDLKDGLGYCYKRGISAVILQ
ncbi:hypothetical protein B0H14DRAFT_2609234 [Mycena olivaceomarginata]|nr:hypothetical protein B0H14DRAFT_2609234 [Mycena olivaceomarginata]